MHGAYLFDLIGIPIRFQPIAGSLLVCLLAIGGGITLRRFYHRHDGIVPCKGVHLAAVVEYLVESLRSFIASILGSHAGDFERLLIAIFSFILISNLLGLVPGLIAPTTSMSVNLSMALVVFVYYNYIGIKHHGFSYVRIFLGPVWWLAFLMLPIELISHLARILSLTLRLTGNMSGEHLVMGVFSHLLPIGLPAVFLFMGLFTAILQAFVFMTLSAIYIFLSIEIDH